MPSALCKYCSQIDFGLLRLPTAGELTALNEGCPAPDRHPFKEYYSTFKSSHGAPVWNLGLQSRIEKEAACQLCAATRHVLRSAVASQPLVRRQWARAEDQDLLCIARIGACGDILPSEGIEWGNTRADVTIRHLSLEWLWPWDDDVCQSPGRIRVPKTPGDDREVLILSSCFQLRSQQLSIRDVVEKNALRPDSELFGGRLVPEFIDPRLPRLWLEDCHSDHRDTCGRSVPGIPRYVSIIVVMNRPRPKAPRCSTDDSPEISAMRDFRLIDVRSARIVQFRQVDLQSLEYATLSYVWGGPLQNALVHANLANLLASGSLANLPKTIEDAIRITKDLFIPFLWVDALCIIQDDDEDKSAQVSNMGSIYSCSKVTLVAAAGKSAHAGLPGVSTPRKATQISVAIDHSGLEASGELLTRLHPSTYIHPTEGTAWASRGWTFQEQELSTRLIYFMDGQVLWSCTSDHRSEETHSETPIAQASWLQNRSQPHLFELRSVRRGKASSPVWNIDWTWKMIVRDFTNRTLTFPGDALDAVTGALQLYQSVTGRGFLWGIPLKGFENNLHWCLLEQPARRTCLTTLPSTSLHCRVQYPSWSWLGWAPFYMGWMPPAWSPSSPGETHLVTCLVLKNSPPRLELVDPEGSNDSEAVEMPSLEEVETILQKCNKTARDIPDDQCLVFKTRRAKFPATKDFKGHMDFYLGVRKTNGPGQMVKTKILNSHGHPVGEYVAERIGELDVEEHVERDFVYLACGPSNKKGRKTVHVLEVEHKDGIWYRLDAADIDEEAWNEAVVSEELVILG